MATNQKLGLRMQSPYGGSYHTWSMDTYFSGSVLTTNAQFQSLVTAVWGCLGSFISPTAAVCQLAEAALYSGAGGVPVFRNLYNTTWTPVTGGPAPLTGNAAAYTGTTTYGGSLATAALLEAPAGISTKGKPVFLRKWVHCVPSTNAAGVPAYNTTGTGTPALLLAPLTNGTLVNGLVATGPSGRAATGEFAPYPTVRWHQLTRGRRTSSSSSRTSVPTVTLLKLLEDAAGDA
jgi:hypothetical protein